MSLFEEGLVQER